MRIAHHIEPVAGGKTRRTRVCRKCGQIARQEVDHGSPTESNFIRQNVVPALTKEFGYKNVMAVPKLEKISVNIGLGEATQNAKLMDGAVNELGQIAGQKPVITKATQVDRRSSSCARAESIGCMVTLRGDRMYEFFDRLVNVALPRVRDFRGVSTKTFDGRGNYTLGIRDQLIFPEIDYSKVDKTKGMNISITTTARTDAEGAGAAAGIWGCRSGSRATRRLAKLHGHNRKDRERHQAGQGQTGEDAEAAVPAPQPLLALRTAARRSCASSACAASASGNSRSTARSRA